MIDAHNIWLRGAAGLLALYVLCKEQQCMGGHFTYMRAYFRSGRRDDPAVTGHAKAVLKHLGVTVCMTVALFFFWGVL